MNFCSSSIFSMMSLFGDFVMTLRMFYNLSNTFNEYQAFDLRNIKNLFILFYFILQVLPYTFKGEVQSRITII